MAKEYDRYAFFRTDGVALNIPFVEVPVNGADKYVVFDKTKMRMDTLSYRYYGDPNYGWLIMQANPEAGIYEYAIKDGTTLRIPYPLSIAIRGYEENAKKIISGKK